MKKIKLINSPIFALIDDSDFQCIHNFGNWSLNKNGYVVTWIGKKKRNIQMQTIIMKPPLGLIIDHRNHITFDNQRLNLRICTNQQNLFNQKSNKHGLFSKYKGVVSGVGKKFRAQIGIENKLVYLGEFETEFEAALAYDDAALKYYKEYAYLNYPEQDYIFEVNKDWQEFI